MNKILKAMIIFYRNIIPVFVRQGLYNLELRITCWYNPLLKNRVTRYAIEDLFEAFKKELENKNNSSLINHNFHKVFSKHLVRSNLIDSQWWSDFILLISLPSGLKFEKINQSLINRIEYSNFNSLDHFEILHIYSLSIRFGLFELGYYIREKSLKIALGYSTFINKSEVWKLKAKLSALLETGNFLEFDQLFSLFKNQRKQEKYLLSNLRGVLGGIKNLSDKNLISDLNSKKDQNFYKFVENKKLVIVSPSPEDKKDGVEIDSADIVIRTRYSAKYSVDDLAIKGSRCDITYIFSDSKYIATNEHLQWPLDISWIVGKVLSQAEVILKKLSADGINTKHLNGRSIERIDKALFNGSLHGLPNIIIDVLRFNPKKIFLYHFDMMLTKERIAGYFTPDSEEENKNIKHIMNKRLTGLAGHDPVTQFVILKSFWKRGIIEGDFRFEEVIKMEVKDYMKNLQKNYRGLNDVKID
jgi:hypothetical protein